MFGIIALVLLVTAALLWHNYCCGRWCIEVLSRTPEWLRQCWRERRAARASARAAPAECAAPPPSAWQLHYNGAYGAKECCAGEEEEEERCFEGGGDVVALQSGADAAAAHAHSDAERGEFGDALGPLPAARGSASRGARHGPGAYGSGRGNVAPPATAAPQAALWHDAAAAR